MVLSFAAVAIASGAVAGTASAAETLRLSMGEGPAFAVLGHWCGGIQQEVYETGFSSHGYPIGNVQLKTTCGGSGKGGGGHSTTYTATASVEWTWFGETRSYGAMSGSLEAKPATDAYGDKLYNVGSATYLERGTPLLRAPAAPTNIGVSVGLAESGSSELLRMDVSWTEAPETEALVKYSTITATPVGSSAPVLTTTTSSNYVHEGHLAPVEPNTKYVVTVTNTDAEGTSETSAPVEVKTPNSDGEAEKERKTYDTCTVDNGAIKLSPGLSETPHVQTITVSGSLAACEGPNVPESGSYSLKEVTTEAVTCSYLQQSTTTPTTTAGKLAVTWIENEGVSTGTLTVPISEASLSGITGSLSGGPFSATTPMKATSIQETFPPCGVPQGKKGTIKPIKTGTFSTSEVEFR
ncbi:MAG TPA: fibronectin type III domain-containing protein [Solirubrobacteraceae bacterium]|nr:fibronectin type III domain-containing protein [Solirubrobacteraceae bacterium]